MNHHLILKKSLLFDQNLIQNLHMSILAQSCFLINWKVNCFPFCLVILKFRTLLKWNGKLCEIVPRMVPKQLYWVERITQLNDISNCILILKSRSRMINYYHNLQKRVLNFLKRFYNSNLIREKTLKYFSYNFQNTNLVKTYLLPKIHQRLHDLLGRSVISNCCTPTKNLPEYFCIITFHLLLRQENLTLKMQVIFWKSLKILVIFHLMPCQLLTMLWAQTLVFPRCSL